MVNPNPFQFQSKFGKPHKQQQSLALSSSVSLFSGSFTWVQWQLFRAVLLLFLSPPIPFSANVSLFLFAHLRYIVPLFSPQIFLAPSVFLYIVLNSNKDSNLGTRLYPSLFFLFPSYFLFSSVSKFIQLISILCCSDVFLLRQLFLGHNWQN